MFETSRGIGGVVGGALAPLRGLGLLCKYPRLWGGVIFALATQILFSALFLAGWIWLALHWLAPGQASGRWAAAAHWVGAGAVALLGVFIAAAAGTVVGLILNPLAYTRLAVETERALGSDPAHFQAVGALRQVGEAIGSALEFVIANGALLALGLFPAAAPFAAVATFVFDAWFLGRMCLEYAQVGRGLRLEVRRARAREYWGLTVGLGSGVVLWGAFPLVGSILTAAAVAGGVELVQGMEAKGGKR